MLDISLFGSHKLLFMVIIKLFLR